MCEINYLPDILDDFHDQKDFFRIIDKLAKTIESNYSSFSKPNWTDAHIYVIDVFLLAMAGYGYKLQKIRSKKYDFIDIQNDLNEHRKKRRDSLTQIFKNLKNKEAKNVKKLGN